MLDWIKNFTKEYPRFWKEYISKFEKKSNRYVVLSTEKTRLNIDKDVILSLGCFGVADDCIFIGDYFEVVVLQNNYLDGTNISKELESTQKKNRRTRSY